MGQRHQSYIFLANPLKELTGGLSKTEKTKLIEILGTGKFTVLPYHNQWLFGRSALQSALNLLIHSSQFPKKEKTSGYSGSMSPILPNAVNWRFKTLEKITSAIGFIMNYMPVKTEFNNAGFLDSYYIGEDRGMRTNFTNGDNNDGITIIDTIENKYCFMNISKPYEEGDDIDNELNNSATDLPYLIPVSASDYVKAYYPEDPNKLSEYMIQRGKDAGLSPDDIILGHIEDNDSLVSQFKDFKVLTSKEVATMFPAVSDLVLTRESEFNLIKK